MTVNPGFGGQAFIEESLDKVKFTRELCDKLRIRKGGKALREDEATDSLPPFDIQVDGGVNNETAGRCIEAGANVLVSGNYLYGSKDMKKAIHEFKAINRG